ncbi:hypothetical protein GCK72_021980 [Caenorhabditis remanei]|uniref:SPK domain-containing protein n=1 Tax=Caenorhabditis remanei TaxID=31234 RepID=A0A6A5GLD4_CAERE|nr:hypothetical protein GCK72_021980 [Caenorhabditis remanei]KAF1755411.1 hypothetical protein GCK72_021980 [Caenorhabditis remanei]
MTQSVSKNNILPEFLQYMIEISEDPVEFKSLEKEARKFYEHHRNEKQIDSIVDRITKSFSGLDSSLGEYTLKQELQIAYTFRLDISNEIREKLKKLGYLEMHYFKIQGFISNDEAFQEMKRIGEPDPQNTIEYFFTMSEKLYMIQSFEDLVARFKKWRKAQSGWGPVDDEYLFNKFANHLTDILPESVKFVYLMHLVRIKNGGKKMALLKEMEKGLEKDGIFYQFDDNNKLKKFEVEESFYKEFRDRLVEIRVERGENIKECSERPNDEQENIVLRKSETPKRTSQFQRYKPEELDEIIKFIILEMKEKKEDFNLKVTCEKYIKNTSSRRKCSTMETKVTEILKKNVVTSKPYDLDTRILIHFALKWPLDVFFIGELVEVFYKTPVEEFVLNKNNKVIRYKSRQGFSLERSDSDFMEAS